jgi:hypothetical protein
MGFLYTSPGIFPWRSCGENFESHIEVFGELWRCMETFGEDLEKSFHEQGCEKIYKISSFVRQMV